MAGRTRHIPRRARRAALVARKPVDVRTRRYGTASDARRHAVVDGVGEFGIPHFARERGSASARPRGPRRKTVNPPDSENSNRRFRMKKSLLMTQPSRARWTALSLALVTGFAALLLTSCKKGGSDTKPADVDYYTCTMHPSVRKQSPSDKCPICSMDLTPVKKKDAAGSAGASDVDYYTCIMHPSVKKQNPKDKCPICSMDLTPVMKKGASSGHDHGQMKGEMESGKGGMPGMEGVKKDGDEQPTEFTVSVERQQQIGVTYATIEMRPFTHSIRAVGAVAYDKQRHWDYVA